MTSAREIRSAMLQHCNDCFIKWWIRERQMDAESRVLGNRIGDAESERCADCGIETKSGIFLPVNIEQ
jgi:hypothetical protein